MYQVRGNISGFVDVVLSLWREHPSNREKFKLTLRAPEEALPPRPPAHIYLPVMDMMADYSKMAGGIDVTQQSRSLSYGTRDPLGEIGGSLYRALFGQGLAADYAEVQRYAQRRDKGVRLRLVLDPLLDPLPWEFLHDGRDFLNLSPFTPAVRAFDRNRVDMAGDGEARGKVRRVQLHLYLAPKGERAAERAARRAFEKLSAEPGIEGKLYGAGEPSQIAPPHERRRANTLFVAGHPLEALHLADMYGRDGADVELLYVFGARPFDGEPLSAATEGRRVPRVIVLDPIVQSPFAATFFTGLLAGDPLETALIRARQEVDVSVPGGREWGLPVAVINTPHSLRWSLAGDEGDAYQLLLQEGQELMHSGSGQARTLRLLEYRLGQLEELLGRRDASKQAGDPLLRQLEESRKHVEQLIGEINDGA